MKAHGNKKYLFTEKDITKLNFSFVPILSREELDCFLSQNMIVLLGMRRNRKELSILVYYLQKIPQSLISKLSIKYKVMKKLHGVAIPEKRLIKIDVGGSLNCRILTVLHEIGEMIIEGNTKVAGDFFKLQWDSVWKMFLENPLKNIKLVKFIFLPSTKKQLKGHSLIADIGIWHRKKEQTFFISKYSKESPSDCFAEAFCAFFLFHNEFIEFSGKSNTILKQFNLIKKILKRE